MASAATKYTLLFIVYDINWPKNQSVVVAKSD